MNILLLTDFSHHASHAHRYALELFKNQANNVYLLHIKKPCLSTQKCSGKCKFGLENKVALHAQKLRSAEHDISPEPILVEGSFLEEVRAAVIKYSIDFLVIGAKGKSENPLKKIGSNTQAIANKVKCPVFIIFENTPTGKPKSALFPVNYTDALYPACLSKLKSLPVWDKLSLSVLEFEPVTTAKHLVLSSKLILEESFKKRKIDYKTIAKPDVVLIKEALKFDLLVFAAKNLSVGNQVFKELKTNKEALNYKTPLLVLHA